MSELSERLLYEVLRDAHHYAPGVAIDHPTTLGLDQQRSGAAIRERSRDLLERAAARSGFSHRHYDPHIAASMLARILELEHGLAETYDRLADERSRRAMLDLLKLRVLGPYHAPLQITAERYRAEQEDVERTLRLASDTVEVAADPWFSKLSLYRVPDGGGEQITLHGHSVDVVNVFRFGQYDHPEVHAESGDHVLDVGGCLGDTALHFASQVGESGRVYTVEFDPENLKVLRANLELNPRLAERIEVVQAALWDASGQKLGFVPAGRMSALLDADAPGSPRDVVTSTLDELVRGLGIERVDLIKMDVEGAEPRVLRGARETLARDVPKLAIAAYHRDDDLVTIPAALDSGYRLYLGSFSALEDETVLFATSRSSST